MRHLDKPWDRVRVPTSHPFHDRSKRIPGSRIRVYPLSNSFAVHFSLMFFLKSITLR